MSRSHNIEKVDTLIKDNYKVSLMSNTKWDKAMEAITDLYEDGVAINYKLVYSDEILSSYIWSPDTKPFLRSPCFIRSWNGLKYLASILGQSLEIT
jgi:hypothetical protein